MYSCCASSSGTEDVQRLEDSNHELMARLAASVDMSELEQARTALRDMQQLGLADTMEAKTALQASKLHFRISPPWFLFYCEVSNPEYKRLTPVLNMIGFSG